MGEALDRGGSAYDDLETDYPNLSATLEWSLSARRTQEMVRVVFELWPVWFNGDRVREAAAWVERAKDLDSSPELDWLRGFLGFQTGDFEAASTYLAQALSAFEAAGDSGGVAMSRVFAGGMAPDPIEGRSLVSEALAYFEGHGRTVGAYLALMFLSVREAEAGDFEKALELRLELLDDPTMMNIDILTAWTHWNIAVTLLALGRTDEAADHSTPTLETMTEMRYQEGIASVGEVLTVVEARRGRAEQAVVIRGGCSAVWDRIGSAVWFEVMPLVEEAMTTARDQLGDVEYERLLTQGRSLSIDGLVELLESV
jgi:tetratricopeptide (TPR) repeat protein